MSRGRRQGGGPRPLRVGEAVRHALAEAFLRGDVHDVGGGVPRVTVTEVRMSPDLGHATVFVVPFAGGDAAALLVQLRGLAPQLRTLIARQVALRRVPELAFRLDTAFDHAERMDALLRGPARPRDDLEGTDG